jgi:dihydrofolate reductase
MKLILASDPRGGIGIDNKLPWKSLVGDLTRFKQLTLDGAVIMGKNTWFSLPKKPLPGRLNFVVTRSQLDLPPGAIAVKDLTPFINYPGAWLIGGAQLVNSSWQYITEVHLTRTYIQYDCDCWVDLVKLETDYTRTHITYYKDHTYEIWTKHGTVPSVN